MDFELTASWAEFGFLQEVGAPVKVLCFVKDLVLFLILHWRHHNQHKYNLLYPRQLNLCVCFQFEHLLDKKDKIFR